MLLILTLEWLYANLNREGLVPKDQFPLYLVFDHSNNHQVVPERNWWKRYFFEKIAHIYFKELYYKDIGLKKSFLYIQASLLTISNSSCMSQGTLPCMTSIIDCGMCAFWEKKKKHTILHILIEYYLWSFNKFNIVFLV